MEDHNETEAHMPSALMEYFADLNKLTYNYYIVEHARHGTTDVCRAHELSLAETCQEPECILKSRAYIGDFLNKVHQGRRHDGFGRRPRLYSGEKPDHQSVAFVLQTVRRGNLSSSFSYVPLKSTHHKLQPSAPRKSLNF